MDIPENVFKLRLKAGEMQYGLWLGLPDASAAEICALAGFDWLVIDAEHAPFDLRSVMAHLQALAAYRSAPIVRPPIGDPVLLKQLLDVGAQTFLIPMVESAAQAKSLVGAVRYPPDGVRGIGTSLARAARWNQIPNYLNLANDQICLIVQVETVEGLDNLAEIANVAGVDGVFIGPSDLAASMGHTGNAAHPDVIAAVSAALTTIRGAGKAAGLLSLNPSDDARHRADGATFIGVGVDTLCLAAATKGIADQFVDTGRGDHDNV